MPSLYGSVGCPQSVVEQLRANHDEIWPAEIQTGANTDFIAGHSFAGGSLFSFDDEVYAGVDGDAAIYKERPSSLFGFRDGFLELNFQGAGNIAVLCSRSRELFLAADWTGSFPLYYARHGGGFLFSSHLRPLARTVGASWNLGAVCDLLETECLLGDETFYRGIQRLLPGQSLRYRLSGDCVAIAEHSRFWIGDEINDADSDAADRCWRLLEEAIGRSHLPSESVALMMSGGWDSRTLLEPLRKRVGEERLLLYSHGDVESRELRIVRDLADMCSVNCELSPITAAAFDLDLLELGVKRTETFHPHFSIAAQRLAARGVQTIVTGVLAAVIGGRDGPASLTHSRLEVFRDYGRRLLGSSPQKRDLAESELDRLCEGMTRRAAKTRPYYIGQEGWSRLHSQDSEPNDRLQKVHHDLGRLHKRGIRSVERLVEAYIVEHRGVQYMLSQGRAGRAFCDISVPFGDRRFMQYAAGLPLRARLMNRLQRLMLERHAPHLLSIPTASLAFVSMGAPLLVRGASQLLRRSLQNFQEDLHFRTRGRTPRPRFGWPHFPGLQDHDAVNALIDDLRCGLWERDALMRRVKETPAYAKLRQHFNIWRTLFKVYTLDRMLR